MRFPLCFSVCTALLACDSPAPAFRNADATKHVIGGNQYSVYVTETQAQAIRTSFAPRPDIRTIARQAETAIETASGCSVTEIQGDVALLTGQLDCTKRPVAGEWAAWKAPRKRGLRCQGESVASHWGDWRNVSLECF
ncbi:hypothetical protein [Cognatishimia maritima]|uniref:Lipoprotein n=1 Tax=Cognatishimia maritima TaxID=870908 RepID=A0A1M5NDT0_9RHOB|nr:hypothetical protein [Cognatishimia maritima]SHG87615.1 hypothetical protein SAMN04488044_1506 [Cognatishimia maritima]